MKVIKVVNANGVAVCERCELADGFFSRFRGLMGRARLEPDQGLMLRPAGSIHTLFMRFPIDAVFLDRELHVVDVRERLRPWRAAWARGARIVLELPAGGDPRPQIGDRLAVEALT